MIGVVISLSLAFSLLSLYFAVSAYRAVKSGKFKEIYAEKLNITEPDGIRRLILFNSKHMPGPVIENKEYDSNLRAGGGKGAGIIFLNDEGTEMGGILWQGEHNGNGYMQNFYFSIDPYLQNEIMNLSVADQNGKRHVSISFIDRPFDPSGFKKLIGNYAEYIRLKDRFPEKADEIKQQIDSYVKKFMEEGTWQIPRFEITKSMEGSVEIVIYRKDGKPGIKVGIEDDSPYMHFYDNDGKILKKMP
jgi:hypothetical protein